MRVKLGAFWWLVAILTALGLGFAGVNVWIAATAESAPAFPAWTGWASRVGFVVNGLMGALGFAWVAHYFIQAGREVDRLKFERESTEE